MIVIDTNVLSEPLRAQPDAAVLEWLAAASDVAVTAVTIGELLVGARALPEGKRRSGLMAAIDRVLETFEDQVLEYDESSTRTYARLQEIRRLAGLPLSVEDGMIAAICLSRGIALATRNTKDFAGLGLELIDPWGATASV
jgi:predicted nucleic acid-binding protein